MAIRLYNTLTRSKDEFRPIDPDNVRMYVCGPTVYDDAHIGNARPVIVFDLLYRLLRHEYGADHVTYARNITDLDDKINKRAHERGVTIRELTEGTTARFHAAIDALGALRPTVEPRATDHIEEMKALCEKLVASGHAYVAEDHVLFSVPDMPAYGRLSQRPLDDMIAGARVDVAPYKRSEMDFVLWKPSTEAHEPGWPSPCGIAQPGRPGWHIECSAMSWKHLGEVFDIHGGGIDLVFPHHENEVAQTTCAFGHQVMANVWMHNGFLQVEGEKMSKSLGNFVTIDDLLSTTKFGGQFWDGAVLRLAMLQTHYRQPIDWTVRRLEDSEATLIDWTNRRHDILNAFGSEIEIGLENDVDDKIIRSLQDDLNTHLAIARLHELSNAFALRGERAVGRSFLASTALLGLRFLPFETPSLSDERRDAIAILVAARLAARKARNFAESDRIRDELVAMGIQLMDGKDPATGEIVTTWEVMR
ncbi:MAG: cysteine--tRNA ligase [Phreatobacter sp.]|uniref:cysteine--tRNA ligase n=1 Tax=Phreatobacter sp. TaxID=1966341 RepID=UPI001A3C4BE1|nr:cysteine--tRNA ligase [Phreatobacter sp.]MBL8568511.1 cysteine--tRNA ligase [Phreatobacter sp.]